MDRFREQAFYQLLWLSILATIVAVILMAMLSAGLVAAALIGANVALLYSVGLIAWTRLIDEERVVRTKPWRVPSPDERPSGPAGRRWARRQLADSGLRFAEMASAVAIALSASALVLANA